MTFLISELSISNNLVLFARTLVVSYIFIPIMFLLSTSPPPSHSVHFSVNFSVISRVRIYKACQWRTFRGVITPLLHVSPQAINVCFSECFAFVFFKELERWVQEGRQSKRHGTLCEVPTVPWSGIVWYLFF